MSSPPFVRARIAIDVGGTFTDVVIEQGSRQWTAKVLTTPDAPERGVTAAIAEVLKESDLRPDAVAIIIHGTTLATNALIERTGARTALLTTEGFRDTIELGTESRFDQYDVNLVKQPPLVPRDWRIPIIERVAADGEILRPLDEACVIEAVERLRAGAIESVAVAFLHSYVAPAHERRVRTLLQQHLPGVAVSLSSEVSPEMREYERFTTTCANAYVQPMIAGYLSRLENDLSAMGFACPLFLMLSGGGITTVETACAFPIRLVESGPAGGAIFARNIAERHGATRAISFDMGGTTAKVCLIDDFTPQTTRLFEVSRSSRFQKGSGTPLRIPAIEMVEIGAGGGSIASFDRLGRISVGPRSAGSTPGPACYGRGGSAPTVTDADVVLGRIDPKLFAGGRMSLKPELARSAMVRHGSTDVLGEDAQAVAFAIAEMVDETMANAARVHAVENGMTVSERTLIAFGGAAPLHVGRLADKLGISQIIIPPSAGVGSAIGFLLAPISYEVARSMYVRLQGFRPGPINALLSSMAEEARAVVAAGAHGGPLTERRVAFGRYVGQGYEIPIALPVRALTQADGAVLRTAFEDSYRKQYGRLIDGVDIEILAWTVTVGTQAPQPPAMPAVADRSAAAPMGWREVFDLSAGRLIKSPVYRRAKLPPGSRLAGPAIIAEESTSTVVEDGYDVVIAGDASIVMTHRAIVSSAPIHGDSHTEVRLQVIWNRLLALVEEAAQTLMRTAFSSTVREAGDLCTGLFDLKGQMLTQAVTGTPGHVNTMAEAVKHLLARFPVSAIAQGDQYVTNDPWLASGHLHDLTVVAPVFCNGAPVALVGCCCHQVDVGGLGQGPDGRSIYEEGLQIPPMKLVKAGDLNEDLLDIVCQNVRTPFEVRGDMISYATANETAARALIAMLDEFELEGLDAVSETIIDRSRRVVETAIGELPKGTWRHAIVLDGYDKPIMLAAALTIGDAEITLDFDGSSEASPFGINVVANYCLAYTAFALKCIIAPDIPNNAGSLAPFRVVAPTGSILNAQRPWPVSARHVVGLMLPDLVFGCLDQALPGRVPAEGASCNWTVQLRRGPEQATMAAPTFDAVFFNTGGSGARPRLDGLSATAFPSGVRAMPIEVVEYGAPVVIWRKELLSDSGGTGEHRGGLGVKIEIGGRHPAPFALLAMFERLEHAAQGRAGGRPGARGRVYLDDGRELQGKGLQNIPSDCRLMLETPGGGGYGDPRKRPPERLHRDVALGLVSPRSAKLDYGP